MAFTFSGCKTYSDEQKNQFSKATIAFAKKQHLKFTTDESGLCISVIEEGKGNETIQRGSVVTINYLGTLTNGTVFDQSQPGKPLKANIKGLIGGFQLGLMGQKKGAKLKLVVPPQLGYGSDASAKIPANSILYFEIEVVDMN